MINYNEQGVPAHKVCQKLNLCPQNTWELKHSTGTSWPFWLLHAITKICRNIASSPPPPFFFFKKRIEKKKGSTLFCKLHLKKKVEKEMIISPDVCQFSWNPLPFRYTLHLSSIVGFALSVISPVVIQDLFVYQSLNLQFAKNLHIGHYF